jgi:ketosteroid isomerase-like protein
MSDSLVDAFARTHRAGQEAFNRGDFEAAFVGLAADVEWSLLPSLLETGTLRGRDAVIRYFRGLQDGIGWRVDAQEFTDLGAGRILVRQRGEAVGRSTGISGDLEFFQIWEIGQGGLPVRIREYETHEEALQAAGLEAAPE